MTPADELRAAAAALEPAVDDVDYLRDNWPDMWAEQNRCELPEVNRYVRSLPPRAGQAVVDLLNAIADDMDEHGAVEGTASKKVHRVSRTLGIVLEPRADWTAALATARKINGGTA